MSTVLRRGRGVEGAYEAEMMEALAACGGTWIGDLIDLIPPPILAGIAVYRIAMTIPAPKWVDAKRKEFQRDMGQYRKVAFFHCCPTIFMLVVWLLVVYNYYAIVRWSDASWPVGVMVTGYGLIALQVASFDRVMRTHPGVLPEEWRVEAHRGHAPFYICRRTGRKLPPRCFHIKSLGQDVLFLDHFCFWLNKPIGLRNRKYFLLFLGYSLLLTVLGVLLVASLLHGVYFNPHTTLRMLLPFAPVTHPGVMYGCVDLLLLGADPLDPLGGLRSAFRRATFLLVADLVALVFLGGFAVSAWAMAFKGRVSLNPNDATYDVGARLNLQQIFGKPLGADF
ncbi:hypothetical protein EMIHUDRAFT_214404 [Emiliania huxleyi CCMP1516]|uniref:Palmitoyltransferase n=2 Tax=Emiliania huxleyi TaxID=2903 RepID=A0A0D3IJY9_EMIH1|nr:hypothetical protein EMIHUDRAFT_214404 [Emiliania huxleyi CCMP1516]EOD11574.1 hypothetical protein EMIHUDRAFT_214404 [Emiliania huxleyi CCMP1516]|eukprot:XP_005764003.1 hypothetical protein EMIHUDRAFT_214404 [Emiliania huxleyi CCMP1516]